MKSLLISSVFPPQTGGSGRWLWEVYRRLPRANYAIVAGDCRDAREFDGTHELDVQRVQLQYPDLGYFSVAGYLRYREAAGKIAHMIRKEQIRAIHCGALLPDGWLGRMLARRFRIPLLVYMHGEETCYSNSSRQLKWMGRKVLEEAKCVIANSENTRSILNSEWELPDEKIEVLHPGVDCEQFKPVDRSETARKRLRWSGRKVILTVGRLQERKGQDMLIRALPQIIESVPDALYAIVGNGADYERLEKLVLEHGVEQHVRFYRDLDDASMTECYQQCDLFVLPNRRVGNDIEGFGMVLLEAQACGKPVIAGDSGGTRETMQIGRTGEVIDCTIPERLAASLTSYMKDGEKLERMGHNGRKWVEDNFDWPVLADQAQTIHRRLHGTQLINGRTPLVTT